MDQHSNDGFSDFDEQFMEDVVVASSILRSDDNWAKELIRKEGGELSDEQRRLLVYQLLGMKRGNKLPWGTQTKLARDVGVHKSTINRLFQTAQQQVDEGTTIDVRKRKKGVVGRKPYENSEEWLQSAPLHKRGSYRAYAAAINCSRTHIWRLLKKGLLRVHTSPNHPNVSDHNKIQRMKWVLKHIKPATSTSKPTFVDMKHTIHIDEKWFYLNPTTRRFIMLPKEADPYRVAKHKNYSIKVMFMGVSSRPLFNEQGEMVHDGKFGIFPFIVKERAKHSSKNRPAGTLETKVIPKINKEVMKDMIINKVLPATREKWPQCMSKDIFIQQDNAKPHLSNNDPAFREAATQDGFNMQLINQPPQSPDFNVLDLGLFRALQSLQYQSFPKDIDDLIVKVQEVYENYEPNLIRFVWITLQYVMVEALKVKGGNNYKLPHVGKARLDRLGLLPYFIEVEQEVIDEAVAYLHEIGAADEDDMGYGEDMDFDEDE